MEKKPRAKWGKKSDTISARIDKVKLAFIEKRVGEKSGQELVDLLVDEYIALYSASDIPPAPVKEARKTDFPLSKPAGSKEVVSVPGTQKTTGWRDRVKAKQESSPEPEMLPVSAPMDETSLNLLRSSAPARNWVTVKSTIEEDQPSAPPAPSVSDWITELRAIEPFDEVRLKDFKIRLDACTTLSLKQKALVK